MNEYDNPTREVQKVELSILKEVTLLCEKHNLTYYLYGGTLIGAVRHKGFIPWDDDIDIAMPRDDYERFLNIAKRELTPHLFLQHYTTEKKFCLLFIKVRDNSSTFIEPGGLDYKDIHQGIYIDIFPLDTISESKYKQVILFNLLGVLMKIYFMKKHSYYKSQTLLQKINLSIYKLLPVGSSFLTSICEKLCKAGRNKKSEYLADLMLKPSRKRIYRSEWFERKVKFEFEGRLYDGPAGYDDYLKHYYGDYMQLPPEAKRRPTHYEVCDPYKSYKEYVKQR
jgi:lipopolysaccharide cholinephosphotransferase